MLRPIHKLICILCLVPLSLVAAHPSAIRRVQAHLLVGDPKNAVCEAKSAFQAYPHDPVVHEWLIRSLAAAGDEVEMIRTWEAFYTQYGEKAYEQDLVEEMCWGVLKKGKKALGTSSQLICVIGAALTQDIRAVPFLLEGLRHSNAHIRLVSVELAALYGDHPLRVELGRLFYEEKVLEVRLKVVKAIGKLKMDEYLPCLMQIVGDQKTGAKEKLAAIEALVLFRDSVEREELEVLVKSKRAGLRQLACEVVSHCELKEHVSLIYPLIFDPQPDVCAAALKTWGLFRERVTPAIQRLAMESLDPTVGVTASWVWLLDAPEQGERAILKWLNDDQAHVRALAASAVAASGKYGVEIAKKVMLQTHDPYVKVNLALALASQREEISIVCKVLTELLKTNRDKWMFSENGLFQTLEKSTLSHNPAIPNFPEVMNQTVRLELLNLLAILEAPDALESIKLFLQQREWGVTGLAAETLLGEGDETAIDLVRDLLEDPNQNVRLEAALVLATWARDHSAIPTLIAEYPRADRQLQIKILESLGRIGDREAIPFLFGCLKEPSLTLRMIAACVLVQTLNH